jgi:hypothetical protein
MTDIKWSAFPSASAVVTGDTLVGLNNGVNKKFPFSILGLPEWNASTNSPALASSTAPAVGSLYVVNTAGNTVLNANTGWQIGDYALFTAGAWTKITMVEAARSMALTNKTISGSSNTLSSIANASLVHSSVTYNGVTVDLGSSGTITAASPQALTVSTGLLLNSGTTYDGSAAKTITIDSTVATLSGTQALSNKTILSSSIKSSTSWVDATTVSKAMTFDLSGKTAATTSTWVLSSGNQTITVPAGNFTIAKDSGALIGNITPFIVGPADAAPYTTITAAGLAASAIASTSEPQFVYIQPGIYVEDPTIYPNVHYMGMAGSSNDSFEIVSSMPVKVQGTFVFNNGLGSDTETNIVGIEIITPFGATGGIYCAGSYNVKINLINSIINASQCNAVDNTNPDFILNCYDSTIQADIGHKAFLLNSGNVNLLNGTKVFASSADQSELFSGALLTIDGATVYDSFDINDASTTITARYAKLISKPGAPVINFVDALATADIQNCIIDSSSPTYVISAALGGIYKYANNVFLDNPLIQPTLTSTPVGTHQGPVSPNTGTYYLTTTLEGDVTANYRAGNYTVVGNVINVVTTNINMIPNQTYICQVPGNIHLTLPISAAVGDTLKICGLDSGGVNLWIINQNAGQSISIARQQTSGGVGGSVSSDGRSSIDLICVAANTTWIATSVVGTLIIV